MLNIRTDVVRRVVAASLIFAWLGSTRAEEVSVSYAAFTASYMTIWLLSKEATSPKRD
jgi:hypothetical protein